MMALRAVMAARRTIVTVPFLLDAMTATSAVAFSVRKLRSAYAGNCIRVRRSSDNTELDIGFDANNNLDVVALLAFAGSGDCFVTTWYDQSTTARHATQTTNTAQPKTVGTGSLIIKNGRPSFSFDGVNDFLRNTTAALFNSAGGGTICSVALRDTNAASTAVIMDVGSSSGNSRTSMSYRASQLVTEGLAGAGRRLAANTIQVSGTLGYIGTLAINNTVFNWTGATMAMYLNGADAGSRNPFQTAGVTEATGGNLGIGATQAGASFWNGHISETLIFQSALTTTDRQIMEGNQGLYFGISVPTAYDSDVQAFITETGITDTTQKNALNVLVLDLKAAGLWSKIYGLYPIVGGNAVAHSRNLKNPIDDNAAYRLQMVGSPTHSSNGIDWNGTNQYARMFAIPSVVWAANATNIHTAYYSGTQTSLVVGEMGCFRGSARTLLSFNDVTIDARLNVSNTTAYSGVNNTGLSTGLFLTSRLLSNTVKVVRNGSILASVSVSGNTPSTNEMLLGSRNGDTTGVVPNGYSTKQCRFASFGEGFSDAEILTYSNIVQNFQTSLGRAIA